MSPSMASIIGRLVINGGVVDHIIGVPGTQQVKEVQPALAASCAEPGEAVIADLRAEAVVAGVPCAGVIDGEPLHRHLTLVMLQQDEAAQFSSEVAADAEWQGGQDGLSLRRDPAFPAITNHPRTQHQILHDEILVALETRSNRCSHLEHLPLDTDLPRLPRLPRCGDFGAVSLSMPLGPSSLSA